MNIWKIGSRWSATGEWGNTVLDIFIKNRIAFIYPDGHNLAGIQVGDLIAISDGHWIVAVGQATTTAQKICDMPRVCLSEADKRKLDGCYEVIEGVRIHLPPTAIFANNASIYYQHTGRFCHIASTAPSGSIKNAWSAAQKTESKDDFNIDASRRTLEELLNDKETRLYMIPIFQRPYAWGEPEMERFLGDLLSSYRNEKRMFIGTMQLSAKRCLSPRGQFFREVIDGQQRLTTCALILKALSLMEPGNVDLLNFCRDFNWIESKVNSGQQQARLDAALHCESVDNPSEGGINRYLDNCAYIKRLLSGQNTSEQSVDSIEAPSRAFSVDGFFQHMVKELLFVVIETQAGLSQTIGIFNIINTTGLDLNGGDLFKVRVYEYLTDRRGESADRFEDISRLYENIDRNTTELRKNYTNIHEIIGIYQKIIVGRYRMGITAARFATETFFDRFFDSLLGLKQWEHFTKIRKADENASKPIIQLPEIERLIEIRHKFEIQWDTQVTSYFDFQTRLAFHLIEWSRYSTYWTLFLIVEFRYPDEPVAAKCAFVQALARLFVVFSTIYGKQINEIHGFMADLTKEIIADIGNESPTSSQLALADVINKIQQHTLTQKDYFHTQIQGDLANYTLPKNLICRLLESLETTDISMLPKIFAYGYDIEHIHSYNHEDHTKRDETWKKWGVLINSAGNLMLLESSLNRSIKNSAFTYKKLFYKKSRLSIANKISDLPIEDWCDNSAKKKLEENSTTLCNYLFARCSL